MEDFKAIKRRRLYQDIVGQIQGFIQEGILKPGDRLPSERELAERLQVSRSSLREAMRALELQGLVVSRPGAGTFVTTDSLDTLNSIIVSSLTEARDALNNIFEVRHLLEPQIAALAAERATQEDTQRMADALDQQEQQLARGETGVEGDTAFHFAVAQATRNGALVQVMSTISDILRQSRDQSLQTPGRPQRSLASHKQMLDMILEGNVEGAMSAMEHHILEVEPPHVFTGGTQWDGVYDNGQAATMRSPT
jgi:GntR family transcriptional repressor for pyruvate dehydrogenase complex